MPQLGESVVEGTIGTWLKAVGDRVEKYEPLVEVVTDKVNTEIPSPVSGVVQAILVEAGTTVPVGTPIAVLAADAEDCGEHASGTGKTGGAPFAAVLAPTGDGSGATARPAAASVAGAGAPLPRGVYSPLVRRLAAEYGVDLRQVPGTGAGGRVTKRDVLAFVEGQGLSVPPGKPAVTASGVVTAPLAPSMGPAAAAPDPRAFPGAAAGLDDLVIPADPMRRAIAQRMSQSKQTVPHAWTMVEVDVTPLVALRERAKEDFHRREGVSLTYVPFFIKAVVESLKEFPHLNASWQDDRIVVKKRIHIGVAVGLEDGLVVPVIRDADRLSISGLARSLADLVGRGRAGKLTVDDVQGATFTVNNTGAFGSVASYPIISPPQAAIITMEAIVRRPVVIGDAIGIRCMMNVCLSFDHRVTDGLYAGRFLQSVKRRLEAIGPDTPLY